MDLRDNSYTLLINYLVPIFMLNILHAIRATLLLQGCDNRQHVDKIEDNLSR